MTPENRNKDHRPGSEVYPPDMEAMESDHEFFEDLCDLIDEHHEETGMSREELLYHTKSFVEAWFSNLSVTGLLWEDPYEE